LYRWIIALAGWIVPRDLRAQWRRGREAAVGRRWIEADRGEGGGGTAALLPGFLPGRVSIPAARAKRRRVCLARPRPLACGRHPVWTAVILLALVFGPGTIRDVWNTLDKPALEAHAVPRTGPGRSGPSAGPVPGGGRPACCRSSTSPGARSARPSRRSAPGAGGEFSSAGRRRASGWHSGRVGLGESAAVAGRDTRAGPRLYGGDDRPGAPPVTLLTHGLWRKRFNADPRVVGGPSTSAERCTPLWVFFRKASGWCPGAPRSGSRWPRIWTRPRICRRF